MLLSARRPARVKRWHARCDEGGMKFLLGLGFGAFGYWAYRSGKLQSIVNGAPEPVQQMFNSVQQAPTIVTPTPAEVAGRPAEPLPRYAPESA
jgi:hypothetical protein